MILCRCEQDIPADECRKIGLFCNVPVDNVISAPDVGTIYEVPICYHERGLDRQLTRHFRLEDERSVGNGLDLSRWDQIVDRVKNPEGEVTIAVVGKYTTCWTYKSLAEALDHGGIANNVRVNMNWIDSEIFESEEAVHLSDVEGILVPGGFGERGAEGKIAAAKFAREHNVPYFGICFGMQMAVIETARSMAGIEKAGSTEFGECEEPIVGLMTEWAREIRWNAAALGTIWAAPCVSEPMTAGWRTVRSCGKFTAKRILANVTVTVMR